MKTKNFPLDFIVITVTAKLCGTVLIEKRMKAGLKRVDFGEVRK